MSKLDNRTCKTCKCFRPSDGKENDECVRWGMNSYPLTQVMLNTFGRWDLCPFWQARQKEER